MNGRDPGFVRFVRFVFFRAFRDPKTSRERVAFSPSILPIVPRAR
jgi:hypothetical protein